jgi:hypothetical protein
MLSLEISKALKEAGLPWEYQLGDRFWSLYNIGTIRRVWKQNMVCDLDMFEECDEDIFAPRLDQLLAEGDKAGFVIEIQTICFGEDLRRSHHATVKKWDLKCLELCHTTGFSEDREEAAAQALLWIIKNESEDD